MASLSRSLSTLFVLATLVVPTAPAQGLNGNTLSREPPLPEPYSGDLRLNVMSDNATTPLEAVPVTVAQGNASWMLTTDLVGTTTTVDVDMTRKVHVALEEHPTAGGGMTVGQQFAFIPALFTDAPDGMTLGYFAPEARSHILSPPIITTDSSLSGRWMAGSSNNQQGTAFQAWIAYMSAPRVIQAYRRFHGEESAPPRGPALLLRVATDVPLGTAGLLLAIDASTADLGPSPQVALTTFGLTAPAAATAEVVPLDESFPVPNDDYVFVELAGILRAGDHLIQLTDDLSSTLATGPSERIDRAAAWIPAALDSCTPGQPGNCPETSCVPVTPKLSDNDCSNQSVTALGGPIDSQHPVKLGVPICAAEGTTVTKRKCFQVTGGLAVEVGVSIPGVGGFKVARDGSVSGTDCDQVSVDGGYCAQMWVCRTITTQVWEVCDCPGDDEEVNCIVKISACASGGATVTSSCQN